MKAQDARRAIRTLLRQVFGVAALRDGQQCVIDSILEGHDTLAIMPTGSGKSLCYQVPARILPGTTVVVSPLISLMKDQLEKLDVLGIRAVQLHSSLSREEEQAALAAIVDSTCDIVFCTPERLAMPAFVAVLRQVLLDMVVIDEAHCISQWGHDFRPAYLELAASIAALGNPPLLALTATATDDVIADIGKQLGRAHMRVINTGVYRANLHYQVMQVTNQDERHALALAVIAAQSGVGIVYGATIKQTEQMYRILADAGHSVALYHGKLSRAERKHNQDLFMLGKRRIMVATNAFGMGIDKRDTRFVMHLQLPANLGAYYQESGRAGRDGADASCILLYYQGDKRVQQFFLARHYPQANDLKSVYDTVDRLCQQGPAGFKQIGAAIAAFSENKLKVCLKLLKDARLLRQDRRLAYSISANPVLPGLYARLAAVYIQKQERDRQALEQMVSYAVSARCRWKLLLEYFDDAMPGFERCGHCDNCRHPLLVSQITIRDDEFLHAPAAPAPKFVIGAKVRVPKFDVGTVVAVAGERITIAFSGQPDRTFVADHVELA